MGICQADPQVATYANDSTERLMIDPMAPDEGWFGGTVTLNLNATVHAHHAYVATPREICRLTVTSLCQEPVQIRNQFYEYLRFGPGRFPKHCQSGLCANGLYAYERDNVFTLAPLLPTPQKVRIYPSDVRDVGFRVLLQGKDQNRITVLTTDPSTGLSAPGEYLGLSFPFVDSVNVWSSISGIQKDETYGPLQFFQVDPNTGTEAPLSSMEPTEGTASYRRYLVDGIPSQNLCCASPAAPLQMTAEGRLDFIPVVNETDYLLIQCVPALIEEAQSIRWSKTENGAQLAGLHHARALALLNGQMDAYQGKSNVAIRVPIFGSARLRPQAI